MSYSVFLWHVPLLIAMWFYLMRENIFLDLKNPVVMILYAIAAWGSGILCYFVLELPFRKVLEAPGRIFGAKKNDN
jgi:peptidoglycan/LPS O-acetylase OafA/YrhL